ncbi:hypothetical protein [Rhodobacter ferrooxidans]|uniref:Sulfotransferase domain-containing protein n=1 Tax=Rhodobacter ferrooxidans TaxID=371731 RepID=C8S050_9RHOB|nr:hypothetical protein [Rhodobacter sp. SW2]EEW25659.1 hypothetical protein Rsw2DRAFT_1428 [Rhodobacter sp. SW2]
MAAERMMRKFVVSAPRSGLNWLRFCVEDLTGIKTPGIDLLIAGAPGGEVAFRRSHDALSWSRSKKPIGPWETIDPADTAGDKVLLLLRDPLEIFVRMAHGSFRRFRCYPANIRFYASAVSTDKRLCYYEDQVADPAVMVANLEFLDITPAPGRPRPDLAMVSARWAEMGRASRGLYSRNQSGSGGAQTAANPKDFGFHQRKLTEAQKRRVWRFLDQRLTPAELALLDRYRPAGGVPAPSLLERLTDRVRMLI